MTLIEWIVLIEIVVGICFLIWLIYKAFSHVKQSPAEVALQKHLAELEFTKQQSSENHKGTVSNLKTRKRQS